MVKELTCVPREVSSASLAGKLDNLFVLANINFVGDTDYIERRLLYIGKQAIHQEALLSVIFPGRLVIIRFAAGDIVHSRYRCLRKCINYNDIVLGQLGAIEDSAWFIFFFASVASYLTMRVANSKRQASFNNLVDCFNSNRPLASIRNAKQFNPFLPIHVHLLHGFKAILAVEVEQIVMFCKSAYYFSLACLRCAVDKHMLDVIKGDGR